MARKSVSSSFLIGIAILWVAAVVVGVGWMTSYQAQAGAAPREVSQWPASALPLSHEAFALTIFLHPQCPCSRASLGELDRLLAHLPMDRSGNQVRMQVTLLDVLPPGSDDNWMKTPTMLIATHIPHVQVLPDANGVISRSFGATTSGYAMLHDGTGKLLFAGGITPGRGHEGDSAGIDAILACLAEKEPATRRTPTYGCSLLDVNDAPTTKSAGGA